MQTTINKNRASCRMILPRSYRHLLATGINFANNYKPTMSCTLLWLLANEGGNKTHRTMQQTAETLLIPSTCQYFQTSPTAKVAQRKLLKSKLQKLSKLPSSEPYIDNSADSENLHWISVQSLQPISGYALSKKRLFNAFHSYLQTVNC
jgi:hypothetical protein